MNIDPYIKTMLDAKLAKGEITEDEHSKIMLSSSQNHVEIPFLETASTLIEDLNTSKISHNDVTKITNLSGEMDMDIAKVMLQNFAVVQKSLTNIQQYLVFLNERIGNIEKKLGIEKVVSKTTKENKINQYVVKSCLGEGGCGKVYLAHDPTNNEDVAIKLLKIDELGERLDRNQVLDEFIREVDIMTKMEHSFVAKVKGVGNYKNCPYVVMEYIEGPTVSELIEQKKIDIRQTFMIANAVASVLKYGHDNYQLIHRDVKPSNIMFSQKERVFKLLDFGLAKCLGDAHHILSTSLTRKGTCYYMSIEQIENSSKVDFRTDIYALGCTMYYMLTGHPPYANYESQGYSAILQAIYANNVIPIKNLKADIPDFVIKIVEKAMAHRKENRYENYDAFKLALKQGIEFL